MHAINQTYIDAPHLDTLNLFLLHAIYSCYIQPIISARGLSTSCPTNKGSLRNEIKGCFWTSSSSIYSLPTHELQPFYYTRACMSSKNSLKISQQHVYNTLSNP
jgi:hypothetical protein